MPLSYYLVDNHHHRHPSPSPSTANGANIATDTAAQNTAIRSKIAQLERATSPNTTTASASPVSSRIAHLEAKKFQLQRRSPKSNTTTTTTTVTTPPGSPFTNNNNNNNKTSRSIASHLSFHTPPTSPRVLPQSLRRTRSNLSPIPPSSQPPSNTRTTVTNPSPPTSPYRNAQPKRRSWNNNHNCDIPSWKSFSPPVSPATSSSVRSPNSTTIHNHYHNNTKTKKLPDSPKRQWNANHHPSPFDSSSSFPIAAPALETFTKREHHAGNCARHKPVVGTIRTTSTTPPPRKSTDYTWTTTTTMMMTEERGSPKRGPTQCYPLASPHRDSNESQQHTFTATSLEQYKKDSPTAIASTNTASTSSETTVANKPPPSLDSQPQQQHSKQQQQQQNHCSTDRTNSCTTTNNNNKTMTSIAGAEALTRALDPSQRRRTTATRSMMNTSNTIVIVETTKNSHPRRDQQLVPSSSMTTTTTTTATTTTTTKTPPKQLDTSSSCNSTGKIDATLRFQRSANFSKLMSSPRNCNNNNNISSTTLEENPVSEGQPSTPTSTATSKASQYRKHRLLYSTTTTTTTTTTKNDSTTFATTAPSTAAVRGNTRSQVHPTTPTSNPDVSVQIPPVSVRNNDHLFNIKAKNLALARRKNGSTVEETFPIQESPTSQNHSPKNQTRLMRYAVAMARAKSPRSRSASPPSRSASPSQQSPPRSPLHHHADTATAPPGPVRSKSPFPPPSPRPKSPVRAPSPNHRSHASGNNSSSFSMIIRERPQNQLPMNRMDSDSPLRPVKENDAWSSSSSILEPRKKMRSPTHSPQNTSTYSCEHYDTFQEHPTVHHNDHNFRRQQHVQQQHQERRKTSQGNVEHARGRQTPPLPTSHSQYDPYYSQPQKSQEPVRLDFRNVPYEQETSLSSPAQPYAHHRQPPTRSSGSPTTKVHERSPMARIRQAHLTNAHSHSQVSRSAVELDDCEYDYEKEDDDESTASSDPDAPLQPRTTRSQREEKVQLYQRSRDYRRDRQRRQMEEYDEPPSSLLPGIVNDQPDDEEMTLTSVRQIVDTHPEMSSPYHLPTKKKKGQLPKGRNHRHWIDHGHGEEKKSNSLSRLPTASSSSDYETDTSHGIRPSRNSRDFSLSASQMTPVRAAYFEKKHGKHLIPDDDTYDYGKYEDEVDEKEDESEGSLSYTQRRQRLEKEARAREAAVAAAKAEIDGGPFMQKDDVEHYRKAVDTPVARTAAGVAIAATLGCIIMGPVGLLVGAAAVGIGAGYMQIPEEQRQNMNQKAAEAIQNAKESALDASEKFSHGCAVSYRDSGISDHMPIEIENCCTNIAAFEDREKRNTTEETPEIIDESQRMDSRQHGGLSPLPNETRKLPAPMLPMRTRDKKEKVACLRKGPIIPVAQIHSLDPAAQPRAWLDVLASADTTLDEKMEALEEILILAKDKQRARIFVDEGILDSLMWILDRYLEKRSKKPGSEKWAKPEISRDEQKCVKLAATCCLTLGKSYCAAIHTEGDLLLMSLYERGSVPEERQLAQMLHEVPHHTRTTVTDDPTIVTPGKETFVLKHMTIPQAEELAAMIKSLSSGQMSACV